MYIAICVMYKCYENINLLEQGNTYILYVRGKIFDGKNIGEFGK